MVRVTVHWPQKDSVSVGGPVNESARSIHLIVTRWRFRSAHSDPERKINQDFSSNMKVFTHLYYSLESIISISFTYCRVPVGRGLCKTALAPGHDETWAVNPLDLF